MLIDDGDDGGAFAYWRGGDRNDDRSKGSGNKHVIYKFAWDPLASDIKPTFR